MAKRTIPNIYTADRKCPPASSITRCVILPKALGIRRRAYRATGTRTEVP